MQDIVLEHHAVMDLVPRTIDEVELSELEEDRHRTAVSPK